MTFLGLEKPVEYQRLLIFDPTTANMVLNALADYVNAMYQDYLRGLEDMKEFNKNFGDFMSPIQKDMDWYDKNVTGKVRNFINNMYANGIDPLRSAEGRAAVSLLIYSMPTGDIAKRKQSAEIAKEYVKNYGTLDAAGKLDPNFERFMLNGMSLEDWDTGVNGVWGRYSPAEYKTLQEYVHPSFANIKPHMMSEQEVRDRGYKYDPRYEYTGVSRADMERSMKDWLPGVRNEGIYRYYREQAKLDLIRRGYKNPTDDLIDRQFVDNAITADSQMMTPLTREANQFVLDDYRTANDMRAHAANKKIDHYYWKLENGGGGDTYRTGYNIPEDVYLTSLAKAAGLEYLPQNGTTPAQLQEMIKLATKRQNDAIRSTKNVLSATGSFIAPEKIAGLIQADGKADDGFFLNSNYFKNLHELADVRTSYKGWIRTGKTKEESRQIRAYNKKQSKEVVSGIRSWSTKNNKKGEYRLKVVPTTDSNGNNTYNMVGDDGRWHTYAFVRVYMNNGKENTSAGNLKTDGKSRDIPVEGRTMALEVGLRSNENAGTPDFSVSARENLGFYGYDATTKEIGKDGNSGFPYGTNTLSHRNIQIN